MKVDQVEKPVDRLSEQEKHTLFYRQISKSRDLEHDLNIYDRAEAGSETRSYKFLLLAAQRNIAKRQEDANVADSRRSHSSGDVAFPAGHKRDRDRSSSKGRSSSRKGKGRGKGKRKGKRRSSSGGSRIPPVTRTCDPGPPLVPPPPGDTHPLVGPAPRLLPVARPEADQENAQVTPAKMPCHYFMAGNCTRDKCPYMHVGRGGRGRSPSRRPAAPSALKKGDKGKGKGKSRSPSPTGRAFAPMVTSANFNTLIQQPQPPKER
jgi:hypothetical protein